MSDTERVMTDDAAVVLNAADELVEADQYGGPGDFGRALMALTRAVNAYRASQR